jgi:hypothetical protein
LESKTRLRYYWGVALEQLEKQAEGALARQAVPTMPHLSAALNFRFAATESFGSFYSEGLIFEKRLGLSDIYMLHMAEAHTALSPFCCLAVDWEMDVVLKCG